MQMGLWQKQADLTVSQQLAAPAPAALHQMNIKVYIDMVLRMTLEEQNPGLDRGEENSDTESKTWLVAQSTSCRAGR